ncbi:MAG: hypothetical protein ABJ327_21825 [Litoreibacter sp.]
MKLDTNLLSEGAFIQEGSISKTNTMMLACTIGDIDYDDAVSELVLNTGAESLRLRVQNEYFVSVDHTEKGDAFVMGEHGTVIRFNWKDATSIETLKSSRHLYPNPLAADTGPMRRLRIAGDVALCVGSFGQVYQVAATEIQPLKFLEIYSEPVTIKEIAGRSPSDFIAVTQHGLAARFDGENWVDLQLPTNLKLTGVTLFDRESYAVVGSGGNLFLGRGDIWHHHRNEALPRDYYSVAELDGLFYLSHIAGVDVFDGSTFSEITYDDKALLEFAFMTRGKNSVWAFSGSTIGEIASKAWTTHLRRSG